jgi:hypothetical protein
MANARTSMDDRDAFETCEHGAFPSQSLGVGRSKLKKLRRFKVEERARDWLTGAVTRFGWKGRV